MNQTLKKNLHITQVHTPHGEGWQHAMRNAHGEEPEKMCIGAWEELRVEGQAGREEEAWDAQEISYSLVDGSEEGLESPAEEEKVHLDSGRGTAIGDMERLSRQRCYAH
jgi:hypothetical protein